jgi:hypothetical protein
MADSTQGSAAGMEADVLPSPPPGEGKYRIALSHPDPEHPNSAVFSWRKLYSFNPDFHPDGWDPRTSAVADLPVARGEFPGHDAWVECLLDNADGTHTWTPVDEEG